MGIFKVILIIIGVIILVILCAGIYLYNFHVFKTVRVCITNGAQDSNISCSTNQECVNTFESNVSEVKESLGAAPDFVKEKIDSLFSSMIFCDKICKIKNAYGMGFGGVQEAASCKAGEQEMLWKIRGKEGIKILLWMRSSSGK